MYLVKIWQYPMDRKAYSSLKGTILSIIITSLSTLPCRTNIYTKVASHVVSIIELFFVDCKFWEVTTVLLKLYNFSIALILTQTTWVRKGGLLLKWSLDHDNLVYKKIPFELLITGVGKRARDFPTFKVSA